MKEVIYKGNLENDIRYVSLEEVKERSSTIKVFRGFGIVGLVVFAVGAFTPGFYPIIMGVGGAISLVSYILNRIMVKQDKIGIIEANKNLDDLTLQLEDNGVTVPETGLKIEKMVDRADVKGIVTYKYSYNDNEVDNTCVEGELERYWSFLDENGNLQVLKNNRQILSNNGSRDITQDRYFLLEEEDMSTLDESIKRTLKPNKK